MILFIVPMSEPKESCKRKMESESLFYKVHSVLFCEGYCLKDIWFICSLWWLNILHVCDTHTYSSDYPSAVTYTTFFCHSHPHPFMILSPSLSPTFSPSPLPYTSSSPPLLSLLSSSHSFSPAPLPFSFFTLLLHLVLLFSLPSSISKRVMQIVKYVALLRNTMNWEKFIVNVNQKFWKSLCKLFWLI